MKQRATHLRGIHVIQLNHGWSSATTPQQLQFQFTAKTHAVKMLAHNPPTKSIKYVSEWRGGGGNWRVLGWKTQFYGDRLHLDWLSDSTFTLRVRLKCLTVIITCTSIIKLYCLCHLGSLIYFFNEKISAD